MKNKIIEVAKAGLTESLPKCDVWENNGGTWYFIDQTTRYLILTITIEILNNEPFTEFTTSLNFNSWAAIEEIKNNGLLGLLREKEQSLSSNEENRKRDGLANPIFLLQYPIYYPKLEFSDYGFYWCNECESIVTSEHKHNEVKQHPDYGDFSEKQEEEFGIISEKEAYEEYGILDVRYETESVWAQRSEPYIRKGNRIYAVPAKGELADILNSHYKKNSK